MKIVIDISEEYYEECKEKAKTGIGSYTRIAEGTPLPKGHGRLIDADVLKTRAYIISNGLYDIKVMPLWVIDESPTIIEADEGGAE